MKATARAYHKYCLVFLFCSLISSTCADKIITAPPGTSWYLYPRLGSGSGSGSGSTSTPLVRFQRSQSKLPRFISEQDENNPIEIKLYHTVSSSWLYGTVVKYCLTTMHLGHDERPSTSSPFHYARAFKVTNPATIDVKIYFYGEREIIPIRQDQTVYDADAVGLRRSFSGHKTGIVDTVPARENSVIDIQ